MTARIGERERLNGGGADDPKLLYQAAAVPRGFPTGHGDASVAGAEISNQELSNARSMWQKYGTDSHYFKNWFGDWRAEKQKVKYRKMEPVEINIPKGTPDDVALFRKESKLVFDKYSKEVIVNNTDQQPIGFNSKGFSELMHANAEDLYLRGALVDNIKNYLTDAVFMYSIPQFKDKGSIMQYRYYGLKALINGVDEHIVFVTREANGENSLILFYTAQTDSELKRRNFGDPPTSSPLTKRHKWRSNQNSSNFMLSQWLSEVNNHSVVVGANGSPLLVSRVNGKDSLQFAYRQPGDTSEGFYLNARNLIDVAKVNGRDVSALKAAGYDGIKTEDGFVVFDETQIKSVNNRGTFSPTDPRKLYQDGGQMPLFPVGGYDQTSGFVPIGEFMDAGWNSEVRPLLVPRGFPVVTRWNGRR